MLELQQLDIEYNVLDIDEDADAGQRLYDLTRDLTVPTLELDDGSIFVRPSREKIYELFAETSGKSKSLNSPISLVKRFLISLNFVLLPILAFALFIFSSIKLAVMKIPQSWILWGLGINIFFGIIIGILQRRNIRALWLGAAFILHWVLLGANLGIGISVYKLDFCPWSLFGRILLAVAVSSIMVWGTYFWWRKKNLNFQRWQTWVGGFIVVAFTVALVFSLLGKPESNSYLMKLMIVPVTILFVIGLFRVIDRKPTDTSIRLAATLVYPMIALTSFLVYL
jgi:hypothetical protein